MDISTTITDFDCRELDFLLQTDIDFSVKGFKWNIDNNDWELFDTGTGFVLARRINHIWQIV